MLLHYNWLSSYSVYGEDGEIGKVQDIYFDEEMWTVRYIVVKTGLTNLSERVFISPIFITKIDYTNQVIRVNISKSQAKQAPDPGEEPITRKYERTFNSYYAIPPYWVGGGVWGTRALARDMVDIEEKNVESKAELEDDSLHVHEAKEVTGYELQVNDDSFGKVDDLLIDEATFEVKYFIVDTKKWLPGGKKVLISTKWVKEIQWDMARMSIDVTREQIESASEYRTELEINDERESELWMHYKK